MIKITPDDHRLVARFVHDLTGIWLDADKSYLIENRCGALLGEYGCASYGELCLKAAADPSKRLQSRLIDAITTRETSFFRDALPFEHLRRVVLPELVDRRIKNPPNGIPGILRVLSAACSTGQEIYSIALMLKDMLGDIPRHNLRLLGVDISEAALERAKLGAYNRFEIERGLSRDKLDRWFVAEEQNWRLRENIRNMVEFKRSNILREMRGLGRFDLVLCRNVAIYFNDADRARLFSDIAAVMEPDGALLVGSTESMNGLGDIFEPRHAGGSVHYRLKRA